MKESSEFMVTHQDPFLELYLVFVYRTDRNYSEKNDHIFGLGQVDKLSKLLEQTSKELRDNLN